MAQKKYDYDSKWNEIEKQEKKGMSKSLLNSVDEIYFQSKKDKNAQQLIRALFYQSRIAIETSDDEDIDFEIVRKFEKEINDSKGVEKAVLQSILAEMFADYYNSNQWDINDRTNTEEASGADFRFWTENIFRQKITELYLSSIENSKILKDQPISNWDYLLEKETETRDFRPTLYDLLAHRAIDFFQTENQYFYGSNYDEETEQKKKGNIILILKDLILTHQSKNPAAAAYNSLELLNYTKNSLTDEDYKNQLIGLSEQYSKNSFTPYLLLEVAKFYKNEVNRSEPEDFKTKKELTEKSISYLDRILNDFPKSAVADAAKLTKKSLLSADYSLRTESFISPDQYLPVRISHRNLDKVYFRILKYDPLKNQLLSDFRYADDKDKQKNLNRIFSALPQQSEFEIDLKSFDDYQLHSTIAKIDPLKSGIYLIMTSNRQDFKYEKDVSEMRYQILNVTDFVIAFRNDMLLLTNRESGKPVVGKTVEVYEKQSGVLKLTETVGTNEMGLAKFKLPESNYRYYTFRIQGDQGDYQYYAYPEYEDRENKKEANIKFFTDRAIYRPGQTVYFKAILYHSDGKNDKKIAAFEKVEIALKDPNGKRITSVSAVSNEFGSVSGEFVLPASGLTGYFTLEDNFSRNDSSYSFSVEEYKRPKFEVEFDKVTDTFKLDEEITAKGKATAYSGANIDNAKVVYRVYRQAVYPYRPWWMRGKFPDSSPSEEIIQGETQTDSDGKFEIKFNAKPAANSNLKSSEKNQRTFIYRVVADVTDINGETRSSEQSITVGDLRFTLQIPISDKTDMDVLDSIQINTNNLNGEFMPAKGKITLTKINPPNRVLRESSLGETDYQLYSKNEFINYFPNDAYGDENKKENWSKESPVLNQDFDTNQSKTLKIEPKNWKEGYYVLKAFIIDGNDSIPYEQPVYLYRNEKKTPADNELFAINLNKNTYKPGENAVVQISSAAQDAEVLVQLEKAGEIVKTQKIKLNNDVKTFGFPIDESDRGNVFVHYYFGKFNTAKSGTLTVTVPYEDRSLKITAGTMRDKLQPGDKEVWELTVSGKDKDKFLAEMLTTMYDTSLDQFRSNSISFPMYQYSNYSKFNSWSYNQSFSMSNFNSIASHPFKDYSPSYRLNFDRINWFGFNFGYGKYVLESVVVRGYSSLKKNKREDAVYDEYDAMEAPAPAGRNADGFYDAIELGEEVDLAEMEFAVVFKTSSSIVEENSALSQVQARKALQETAFFYPNLKTDQDGNVKIQFTTPESLTAWKFMAMAHTPDLRTGYFETTVRTQKDLMVVPNPPRFLREGDQIVFSSKVTNLSDQELKGQAKLMLFDAFSMQPLDQEFGNLNPVRNITVKKGNSDNVSWTLTIPKNIGAVVYRVVASAGDFSDGEESALTILTNRMMVTETMPIHVREGQTKNFSFDKLKNNTSSTLDNFKLTFEMTTNPIWYAIFSLPYLREYPYECSEQVFARLYGNLISQHIIHSNPKIKAVFDDWNRKGELVSKLEQNQELKSILLEETPWVRQSENEEEQMKRIAVLFDLNQMQNEFENTFRKLQNKQYSNGGFPWFESGNESRYITTHIVSGFGHLQKMGIDLNSKLNGDLDKMLKNAIRFIDAEIEKDWDKYQKNKEYEPSVYTGIQYLYARSFFLEKYPLSAKGKNIRDYFLRELNKDKFDQPLQTQAMLSLIFNRYGKTDRAKEILISVRDSSVESDEFGMYWKANKAGWYWYQAPIETQAMLIEAFDEVLKDVESVESMKVWLLKNRQTNRWSSTKATTEAVYVLMNTGKDWTNSEEGIFVKIGNENLDLKALENAPQSGTGYIKTSWSKSEIKPEMGEVEVQKTSPGVAWGAMYWQYFEDLDKITSAETGVKFKKELFLKKNSDKGPVLTRITENTPIQIGDLVTVRLEIQSDREMEFVHIKDMRASGFEPVNVFSTYKWQQGMGYYESTRDAATNFFIDRMPKGTYVFEYDLRANNAGNFSNGITSLQNMYAPELSAHSEGIRVFIK